MNSRDRAAVESRNRVDAKLRQQQQQDLDNYYKQDFANDTAEVAYIKKHGKAHYDHDFAYDLNHVERGEVIDNSIYDDESDNGENQLFSGKATASDIENRRAEQQSGFTQVGAGLVKGLGNVATTALGGTLGAVYGLGSMIVNQDAGKFFNNDFSTAMNNVSEALQKSLPNYQTYSQQNGDWSSLLSANGLASLLENTGFAVGSGLAAWATGGIGNFAKLGAITRLALGAKGAGIATMIAKDAFAAAGEATVEAKQNLEQFGALEIQKENDRHQGRIEELQSLLDKNPNDKDVIMQMNIENNAHMKGLQAIEQAKKNMGAEDFVANMGILMLGNIPQMGSILKSGFKVSRMTEKKLKRTIDGLFDSNRSTVGKVWSGVHPVLSEGREELMQSMASGMSGDYEENKVNNYINKMRDPEAKEEAFDALQSFISASTDKQNLQGAAMGALTGATGMPGMGGWAGGIYKSVKECQQNWDKEKAMAETLNKIEKNPKQKALYYGFVRNNAIQKDMDDYLEQGDQYEYKNSEFQQQCSNIGAYMDAGVLSDYKQKVAEGLNSSRDNLQQILNATMNKDGTNDVYPDIDLSNPADEEKMRKMVDERRKSTLKFIDEYAKQRREIDASSKVPLDAETINTLTWMKCSLGNVDDRMTSILKDSEVQNCLSDVSSRIDKERETLAGKTDKKSTDRLNELNYMSTTLDTLKSNTISKKPLTKGQLEDLYKIAKVAGTSAEEGVTSTEALKNLIDVVKLRALGNQTRTLYDTCCNDPTKLFRKKGESERAAAQFDKKKFATKILNILNEATTPEELGESLQQLNMDVPQEVLDTIVKEAANAGNKVAKAYLNREFSFNEKRKDFLDAAEKEGATKENGYDLKEDPSQPYTSVSEREKRYRSKVDKALDTTKEQNEWNEADKKRKEYSGQAHSKQLEKESLERRKKEIESQKTATPVATNNDNDAFVISDEEQEKERNKEKRDEIQKEINEWKEVLNKKAETEEEKKGQKIAKKKIAELEKKKKKLEGSSFVNAKNKILSKAKEKVEQAKEFASQKAREIESKNIDRKIAALEKEIADLNAKDEEQGALLTSLTKKIDTKTNLKSTLESSNTIYLNPTQSYHIENPVLETEYKIKLDTGPDGVVSANPITTTTSDPVEMLKSFRTALDKAEAEYLETQKKIKEILDKYEVKTVKELIEKISKDKKEEDLTQEEKEDLVLMKELVSDFQKQKEAIIKYQEQIKGRSKDVIGVSFVFLDVNNKDDKSWLEANTYIVWDNSNSQTQQSNTQNAQQQQSNTQGTQQQQSSNASQTATQTQGSNSNSTNNSTSPKTEYPNAKALGIGKNAEGRIQITVNGKTKKPKVSSIDEFDEQIEKDDNGKNGKETEDERKARVKNNKIIRAILEKFFNKDIDKTLFSTGYFKTTIKDENGEDKVLWIKVEGNKTFKIEENEEAVKALEKAESLFETYKDVYTTDDKLKISDNAGNNATAYKKLEDIFIERRKNAINSGNGSNPGGTPPPSNNGGTPPPSNNGGTPPPEPTWNPIDQSIDNIIPAIPEVASEGIKQHDFRTFAESHPAYKAIYDYLVSKGAFAYVDEGNLEVGDKLTLVIDPAYEASIGNTDPENCTIFMMKGNQVVNVLAAKQSELREAVIKQYKERKKGDTSLFRSAQEIEISELKGGVVPKTESSRSVDSIIKEGEKIYFVYRAGGAIRVENMNKEANKFTINTAVSERSNQVFFLVKDSDGTYREVEATPKVINQVDTTSEPFASSALNKKLDSIFSKMAKVTSDNDLKKCVEELKQLLYFPKGDQDQSWTFSFHDGSRLDENNQLKPGEKYSNKGITITGFSVGPQGERTRFSLYINFTKEEKQKDGSYIVNELTEKEIVEQIKFDVNQHSQGSKNSGHGLFNQGILFNVTGDDQGEHKLMYKKGDDKFNSSSNVALLVEAGVIETHATQTSVVNCHFVAENKGTNVSNQTSPEGNSFSIVNIEKNNSGNQAYISSFDVQHPVLSANGKSIEIATIDVEAVRNKFMETATEEEKNEANKNPYKSVEEALANEKDDEGNPLFKGDETQISLILLKIKDAYQNKNWGYAENMPVLIDGWTLITSSPSNYYINIKTGQVIDSEKSEAAFNALSKIEELIRKDGVSSFFDKTFDINTGTVVDKSVNTNKKGKTILNGLEITDSTTEEDIEEFAKKNNITISQWKAQTKNELSLLPDGKEKEQKVQLYIKIFDEEDNRLKKELASRASFFSGDINGANDTDANPFSYSFLSEELRKSFDEEEVTLIIKKLIPLERIDIQSIQREANIGYQKGLIIIDVLERLGLIKDGEKGEFFNETHSDSALEEGESGIRFMIEDDKELLMLINKDVSAIGNLSKDRQFALSKMWEFLYGTEMPSKTAEESITDAFNSIFFVQMNLMDEAIQNKIKEYAKNPSKSKTSLSSLLQSLKEANVGDVKTKTIIKKIFSIRESILGPNAYIIGDTQKYDFLMSMNKDLLSDPEIVSIAKSLGLITNEEEIQINNGTFDFELLQAIQNKDSKTLNELAKDENKKSFIDKSYRLIGYSYQKDIEKKETVKNLVLAGDIKGLKDLGFSISEKDLKTISKIINGTWNFEEDREQDYDINQIDLIWEKIYGYSLSKMPKEKIKEAFNKKNYSILNFVLRLNEPISFEDAFNAITSEKEVDKLALFENSSQDQEMLLAWYKMLTGKDYLEKIGNRIKKTHEGSYYENLIQKKDEFEEDKEGHTAYFLVEKELGFINGSVWKALKEKNSNGLSSAEDRKEYDRLFEIIYPGQNNQGQYNNSDLKTIFETGSYSQLPKYIKDHLSEEAFNALRNKNLTIEEKKKLGLENQLSMQIIKRSVFDEDFIIETDNPDATPNKLLKLLRNKKYSEFEKEVGSLTLPGSEGIDENLIRVLDSNSILDWESFLNHSSELEKNIAINLYLKLHPKATDIPKRGNKDSYTPEDIHKIINNEVQYCIEMDEICSFYGISTKAAKWLESFISGRPYDNFFHLEEFNNLQNLCTILTKTKDNKKGLIIPGDYLHPDDRGSKPAIKKNKKEEQKETTSPKLNSTTKSSLPIFDIVEETDDEGNELDREVSEEETIPWNKQKELTWLGKVLPQFSVTERLRFKKDLLRIGHTGRKAWGKVSNGIMTLSEKAASGTVFHEAFHEVFHYLISQSERSALLKEMKQSLGKDMTDVEAEEAMAEAFRMYVQSEQNKKFSLWQKIKDFFKILKLYVKKWRKIEPHLDEIYFMINHGMYKNDEIQDDKTDSDVRYSEVIGANEKVFEEKGNKTEKKEARAKNAIIESMSGLSMKNASEGNLAFALSADLSRCFNNSLEVATIIQPISRQVIKELISNQKNDEDIPYRKVIEQILKSDRLKGKSINLNTYVKSSKKMKEDVETMENTPEEYHSPHFKNLSWDFIDAQSKEYLLEKGVTGEIFNKLTYEERKQILKCIFF